MKITLSSSTPSQFETECLVVAVVDTAKNPKTAPPTSRSHRSSPPIPAVLAAAADLVTSGEVTGKVMETTLLHKPAGLKAKRLLLIGGGKAKAFSTSELRKIAGTAVRCRQGEGPEDLRVRCASYRKFQRRRRGKIYRRRRLCWRL